MSISQERLNKAKEDIYSMKQNSPGIKPNFSRMAKETGVSRQTLSRLWKDDKAVTRPRKKKPSQFDPYYSEIRQKFEENTAAIKAIFKYFQLKYPGSVFKSYDSFKHYVKANRFTELRQNQLQAHVRFEIDPGQTDSGQLD